MFTFYNGKGCVGGGKSVLKINSMTWKINRQKKSAKEVQHVGLVILDSTLDCRSFSTKSSNFGWHCIHLAGQLNCMLYIVQGLIFRFAEYSLQPQEKSLIVLLELQVERVVFMPNKGKRFFIGSLQLL